MEVMAQIPLSHCSSLNVFHREPHPSSFKAGGYKEGLSIISILNHTKVREKGRVEGGDICSLTFGNISADIGRRPVRGGRGEINMIRQFCLPRRLLRRWLMEPLQDIKEISARQVRVEGGSDALCLTDFAPCRTPWSTLAAPTVASTLTLCRATCVTFATLAYGKTIGARAKKLSLLL